MFQNPVVASNTPASINRRLQIFYLATVRGSKLRRTQLRSLIGAIWFVTIFVRVLELDIQV